MKLRATAVTEAAINSHIRRLSTVKILTKNLTLATNIKMAGLQWLSKIKCAEISRPDTTRQASTARLCLNWNDKRSLNSARVTNSCEITKMDNTVPRKIETGRYCAVPLRRWH